MTISHQDILIITPDIPIEAETWNGLRMRKRLPFCNYGCQQSYNADRRCNLIPGPPYRMEFDSDNIRQVGCTDGRRWTRECAYCGADLTPTWYKRRIAREQSTDTNHA